MGTAGLSLDTDVQVGRSLGAYVLEALAWGEL